MRTIKRTKQFKKDYKRQLMGRYRLAIQHDLIAVVKLLVVDALLPKSYYDHGLIGEWKDHRDCHIKPDLILIYRKPDKNTLELIRLGSHSELSL